MNDRNRTLAAAVGVASLAGGVLSLLTIGGAISGASAVLYGAGGLLGVAMTYLVYRDWSSTADVDLPPVEDARELPTPGEAFDRTLAQFDGRGEGHLPDRQSIHRRLVELGARVLAHDDEYTHEEALSAIEAGDWPGDPAVAAFLEDPDETTERSVGDRVRAGLGRDDPTSTFQRRVRQTVDEFARRVEIAGIDPDAGESTIDLTPAAGEADRTAERSGVSSVAADGAAADREVSTGRWRAVVPVALAAVGFGFLIQEVAVVFAGAVGAGLGVYAEASPPVRAAPVVERTVDDDDPSPGDEVEVTVTLRNESDRFIPDVTVVDDVPEGLSVTDGSPRHATALRPGRTASFSYSVTARRGAHSFGPVHTVVRDLADTVARVRRVSVSAESDGSMRCVPSPEAFPTPVALYEQTGGQLGRLPAGGGEGIEFHSTREYRPGDSMSRIDWKHLARSAEDELTTVRFRQERAATVALVVDTYPVAYLASGPGDSDAVDQSISAAARLGASLLADGDQVGVAALGERPLWVTPDAGLDHRKRLEKLLATDPAFPPTPPGSGEYHPRWVREFHRRFPSETQVILLSPLCDERYLFLARRLRGFGHPVTIVSPDPTVDGTVGQRLVRMERRMRIEALREAGVRVIDWDPTESLAASVSRAAERWSV